MVAEMIAYDCDGLVVVKYVTDTETDQERKGRTQSGSCCTDQRTIETQPTAMFYNTLQ